MRAAHRRRAPSLCCATPQSQPAHQRYCDIGPAENGYGYDSSACHKCHNYAPSPRLSAPHPPCQYWLCILGWCVTLVSARVTCCMCLCVRGHSYTYCGCVRHMSRPWGEFATWLTLDDLVAILVTTLGASQHDFVPKV